MAFLDNSGDIILDAVLTDAGRKRLARGDGTFKVTKYAFGDDEIDYSSYNAFHDSGSAYFDLEILQTPVLEAFTNNASSLKSKLITLTNNNLLFLPEMVLNQVGPRTQIAPTSDLGTGIFLAAVDLETETALGDFATISGKYIRGSQNPDDGYFIRVDQGLATDKLSPTNKLSSELTERQYMIQMDNRLGMLVDVFKQTQGTVSFVDDDQIATYYLTQGVGDYIKDCLTGPLTGTGAVGSVGSGMTETSGNEILAGPRGTKLRFSLRSSSNLQASDYLFDTIGQGTVTDGTATYKVLDTTIKIIGITTGYSIDIPVRYLKKTT